MADGVEYFRLCLVCIRPLLHRHIDECNLSPPADGDRYPCRGGPPIPPGSSPAWVLLLDNPMEIGDNQDISSGIACRRSLQGRRAMGGSILCG